MLKKQVKTMVSVHATSMLISEHYESYFYVWEVLNEQKNTNLLDSLESWVL